MSSFAERAKARGRKPSAVCATCVFLSTLDKKVLTDVNAALSDPSIPVAAVFDEMRETFDDFTVEESAFKRHVGGGCNPRIRQQLLGDLHGVRPRIGK